MGWVSGARLTAATANGRRPRHPRLGDDDLSTSCKTAIGEVKDRAPGKNFGVNLRADQPDIDERHRSCCIREGVKVASFAQAPSQGRHQPAQGRRHRHHAHHRRHAPRREGGRVGRRRGHRPGRRGRRPHRHRADVAAAARRWSTPSTSRCIGAGGFTDGRGLGGRAGLGRVGHRHGHAVPAHLGLDGARRRSRRSTSARRSTTPS